MNNMKTNPITIMLFLIFFYPLIKGFLFKFSSRDFKGDIDSINRNISFLVAIFLGVYSGKKIFIEHQYGVYMNIYKFIPDKFTNYINNNIIIVYSVLIPIIIFLIYKIIKLLLNLINYTISYPILDTVDKFLKTRGNFFNRIAGTMFQIPKAICYVIFIVFIINITSIFNISEKLNRYAETSRPYNYICREIVIPVMNSTVAKKLPNIIDNSFKVVIKNPDSTDSEESTTQNFVNKGNTIAYYNGVTLDQGVKSNDEIDQFSRQITKNYSGTREKAKIIYDWVGSNISYDHEKANSVLNNNFNVSSGAIPAFNTRKGICFDYSCLYVAMARANNIKVRLVIGEGFNGVSWVSHAWNQVYIPEENKWINIDTTFYNGGNYFDNRRFNLDHRSSQIIGEW